MKTAYLITRPDGTTITLFDRVRAHGIAGHFGYLVRTLTEAETRAQYASALRTAGVTKGGSK